MPISLRDTDLGRELIRDGEERTLAALLRRRFGDDPRIDDLAARLARQPIEDAVDAIESAGSIDQLA